MGCPVIVSDLGALPETIDATERDGPGFTGWLVSPGNVEALADRIRLALMLTAAERSQIGSRAHSRIKALFQLAQMQVKTLAVYDELLGTELVKQFG